MFRVGDRVRVVCRDSVNFGAACTIVKGKVFAHRTNTSTNEYVPPEWVYNVDIENYAYTAEELEPIYDGNELSTWAAGVWVPNDLKVTT